MSRMIPVRKLNDGITPYYPLNVPETVLITHDISVRGKVGGYSDGEIISRETPLDDVLIKLFNGGESEDIRIDNNTIVRNENNAICVAPIHDKLISAVSDSPVFDTIKYYNGRYLAGNSSGLYYSYDALTWYKYEINNISVSTIVSYSNKIVFGGYNTDNNAVIGYSVDNGNTFTLCNILNIESYIQNINRIEYNPSKNIWVASNYATNESRYYYYSDDAINWKISFIASEIDSDVSFNICNLKFLNNKWYAFGYTEEYSSAYVTDDPAGYWSEILDFRFATNYDFPHVHSIDFSGNTYIAGYTNRSRGIWRSQDGENFIHCEGNLINLSRIATNGLYFKNGLWFALDRNSESSLLYSKDQGITWYKAISDENESLVYDEESDLEEKLYYHNGVYVLIRQYGIAYSTDGINWTNQRFSGAKVNSCLCVNKRWIFATNRGIYICEIASSKRQIIDSEFDVNSTNPVENRVIAQKILELSSLDNLAKLLDPRPMPEIITDGSYKVYDQSGVLTREISKECVNLEDGFRVKWNGDFWFDNSNIKYKKADTTKVAEKVVTTQMSDIYEFGTETTDLIDKSQHIVKISNKIADQVSIDSISEKFRNNSTAEVKYWNYTNICRRPITMNIDTYKSAYIRMAEGNPNPTDNLYPADYGWAYNSDKTYLATWSPSKWGLQYMYRYLLHERVGAHYYLKYPADCDTTNIDNLLVRYKNSNTGDSKFFDYEGSLEESKYSDGVLYFLADSAYLYKKIIRQKIDGSMTYLTNYNSATDAYTLYTYDNNDIFIKVSDSQDNNNPTYIKATYEMTYSSRGTRKFVDIGNEKLQLDAANVLVMDELGFQITNGFLVKENNTYKVNRFYDGNDVNYVFDDYEKVIFTISHSSFTSPVISWKKSKYDTFESSNIKIVTRTVNGDVHTIITNNDTELDITAGGVSVWLYPSENDSVYTCLPLVQTKDTIYINENDQYYLCLGNYSIDIKAGTYVSNGRVKGVLTSSTVLTGSATYNPTYDSNRYQILDNNCVYISIDPELLGIITSDTTSEFYYYISNYGKVLTKKIGIDTNDADSFDSKLVSMETPSGLVINYKVYVSHTARFNSVNERIFYTTEDRKLTARYVPPEITDKPLFGRQYYIDEWQDLYDDMTDVAEILNINDIIIETDDDLVDAVNIIVSRVPALQTLDISTDIDDETVESCITILETLGADVIVSENF